jgi:DNA polymerase-3 subunit alpha
VGRGAIDSIIAGREAGRFATISDLADRIDLRLANKRVFEALIKSGACDVLVPRAGGPEGPPLRQARARLLASIDAACEHGARTQRDRDLGQSDLFGGTEEHAAAARANLPEAPPWTEIEQLNYEKEALGLYWTGHPIDRYADDLREYGAKSTTDLNIKKRDDDFEESGAVVSGPPAGPDHLRQGYGGPPELQATAEASAPHASGGSNGHTNGNGNGNGLRGKGEEISIGGIVSGLRPLKTRKGDRMCVFSLEDAGGSIEIVVFPEAFKQHGHLADNGQTVLVKGKFERDDESARIIASEIAPIGIVRERLAKSVAIRLTTPPADRATFERLWDLFAQHKGDRRIAIVLHERDRHIRITVDVNGIRVRPSETLVTEVEKICGAGSVSLR